MDKNVIDNTVVNMTNNEAIKKIEEIKSRNIIKKGVGARTKAEREYLAANSYTYAVPKKRREVDYSLPTLVLTYGRVSHLKEDSNSGTFERQSDTCLNLQKADGLGHITPIYFEDESISAFHTKQREGMDTLVKFCEEFTGANPIYAYVEHVDRWVRNKEVADKIFAILKQQNIKLRIGNLSNVDLTADDLASNIILDVMVQMAEGYSKSISTKATGGQEVRAKKGLWRNSVAPYGMKIGKKMLDGAERSVLEPGDNAEVVKDIFNRINLGDSINDIVRYLNNNNIKAPGIAEIWRDSTITFMLLNPHYAGYTRYNTKRKYKKYQVAEQIIKDANGDYMVTHEGIISPEQFWTTLAILKGRHRPKGKKRNTHILSGVLVCADCGAKLYGAKGHGSSSDAYRCPDSFRDGKKMTNSISAKGLEELIKGMAKKIIADKDLLNQLSVKPVTNLEEVEAAKQLILQEISELQEMIAKETRPNILKGLKAGLEEATFNLEKQNTNAELSIKFASKALISPQAFEECWTNKDKTAIILALKAMIDRIEVEPLGDRQKLNNVLLRKKGWLFDYTRVTIYWQNGEKYQVAEGFANGNKLMVA